MHGFGSINYMKKLSSILISLFLVFSGTLMAQHEVSPKHEYRAVWLATIKNLDWPRTLVTSPQEIEMQQQELKVIMDSLQVAGINTVMLQTRVRGNVIYPSSIEPFSGVFTGAEGLSPGYDPLAFAIDEAHSRGMQLHAWIVSMPVGNDEQVVAQGELSLPSRMRALCTHYKEAWYMEPGNPAVAPYLASLVTEVVSNYDVDGIHLDYIRYPDFTDGYPDAALHRRYGGGRSLAEWRRGNITDVVKAVYAAVKEVKPWVRVSSAPLGKYDTLTRYNSFGWDAYNAVFQEAQEWLRDGVMDALFPMLYYKGNHFYPFVRDWCENSYGRHVVPGLGIYRLQAIYGGWEPLEIERQMRTSRLAGAHGIMMFRTAHLLGNAGGAYDIYTKVYKGRALVPPMTWHGTKPSMPQLQSSRRENHTVEISWSAVEAMENHPAVRYNVYMALDSTVDISDVGNLVSVEQRDTAFTWHCRTYSSVTVAVTAVDAYGVESEPMVVVFEERKLRLKK